MTLRSLVRRRLSAPLVVSFIALFVALGGAGWAALRVPPNSVGTTQLQNFSVSNAKLRSNAVGPAKIAAGAVGARQVDSSQVQLRLTSSCPVGAIQSISVSGNVTCTQVLPNEFGTTAPSTPVGTGNAFTTLITGMQLGGAPGGNTYLVFGNVQWTISGTPSGPQSVDLKCGLQGSGNTAGESIADLDVSRTAQAGTIPIIAPATITGSHGMVPLTCGYTAQPSTPAPTVTATATLGALQTAANNAG
jgi:hypothetical protein